MWWSSHHITSNLMFYTMHQSSLESCISQLSIDLGCSTRSLVVLLSYNKQPDGPSMHWRSLEGPLWLIYWGSTYIWCTVRILYITNSQIIHSMHQRSLEGPLWLMHWGYTYIWCTVRIMHIIAFHWCKILNKKLGGPLIISQTAGWSIQCIGDHLRGCFDGCTMVTNIYDASLTSCISQLSIHVGSSPRSVVVLSSYHKQPDGQFNSPEIIEGAALTNILRLLSESCISQTAR